MYCQCLFYEVSCNIFLWFQVPFGIFCMFDGHGGSAAADAASRYQGICGSIICGLKARIHYLVLILDSVSSCLS